ncbi:probable protein arginine N-methyltransferase 3 [Nicotiana tomentosiformis]|uniref:probable protein arginine N-methyltransferase 3 n=1 Tax=Nicotiana tomentosiformis TaxID=4098 RepID=UPI00051C7B73|nr:probable protein arginine N-methyltransferase 3 [Nicotiana tomentosiformis]
MAMEEPNTTYMEVEEAENSDDYRDQNWDDWKVDENGDEEDEDEAMNSELLCLFCDSLYNSSNALFEHCSSAHRFNFNTLKTTFALDFYGCFKLINYIRSKVAENKCWSCGIVCRSKEDLLNHLHEVINFDEGLFPWNDDEFLKPLNEDALLYSFDDADEGDDVEDVMSVDKKELIKDFEHISIDEDDFESETEENKPIASIQNGGKSASVTDATFSNGIVTAEAGASSYKNLDDQDSSLYIAKVAANKVKDVNKSYFGGYSSYGIHRDMISDKVRTDAYRQAILENPSLIKGAVVMDVGCGTGILSLFAAQAGASRVIAVEASEKMAAVAAQIAKDNNILRIGSENEGSDPGNGVMEVVQGMVEELQSTQKVRPHSVDVLVSEWMGYCLLYESMLSSVLYARDQFLKPGGAVLPDMATMFVAGFGRGGTSIPFWENIYGFNMSCIGEEIVKDASRIPIVDVIDSCDIITNSTVLQNFDLVTMKLEEMDFTAKVELELKGETSGNGSPGSKPITTWCYGVVIWFETGFTERFCKEKPTVLSTSPHTPSTHWSQTVLTFSEPIAMVSSGKLNVDKMAAVGTDACPAVKIQCRISVVRAAQHRSIDISMELSGIGPCGRKRNLPAQMFNL